MRAIGTDAKIRPVELDWIVLPTLESLSWIKLNYDQAGKLISVDDVVPPTEELIALASKVLEITVPSPVETAALEIMRATTRQPLERAAAIEAGSSHGEQASEDALRHLVAVRLVRETVASDGRSAVFNPNIWLGDEEVTEAALRVEDARVRREVGANRGGRGKTWTARGTRAEH